MNKTTELVNYVATGAACAAVKLGSESVFCQIARYYSQPVTRTGFRLKFRQNSQSL
jgi:hypothetical protein